MIRAAIFDAEGRLLKQLYGSEETIVANTPPGGRWIAMLEGETVSEAMQREGRRDA